VKPSLKTKVASHYRLNKSLSTVSGGIVYLIQLGNEFKANGMREMDEDIIPQLEKIFPANAFHRIIPQYAALKWFCNKVCTMSFCNEVFVCGHRFQSQWVHPPGA
jgi:hypothetical protein